MVRPQTFKLLAACVALDALAALPCAARDPRVVEEFEYVQPTVSRIGETGELRVTLPALGHEYRLRVDVNPQIDRWAESGLRHYRGTLEGVPGSWVRVSIEGESLRGVIYDGHELLAIEPEDGGLAMFRMADASFEPQLLLADDALAVPGLTPVPAQQKAGGLPAAPRLEGVTATRELEISAVGDAAFRARFGSDAAARDAVLTRLNVVDGIFSSQVGVAIAVASINIADSVSNQLDASTDPPLLLDSLGRLRQQTPELNARGLTHLFTGRALDGSSVGIGYSGLVCNRRYSASLAEAHNDAGVDGLVSAHEIGHVFGAPHDGDAECAATSPTDFIMAATLNPRASSFSQCSLDQMAPHVASASCLRAVSAPPPSAPPVDQPPPPERRGGGGGALDALLLAMLAASLGAAARRRAG